MWIDYLTRAAFFASLSHSGQYAWDTPEVLDCKVSGAVTSVRLPTRNAYSQFLFSNVSSFWIPPEGMHYVQGRVEIEAVTSISNLNSIHRILVNGKNITVTGSPFINNAGKHVAPSPEFPRTLSLQLSGGLARTFVYCISFHAEWENTTHGTTGVLPSNLVSEGSTSAVALADIIYAWFLTILFLVLAMGFPVAGYIVYHRSARSTLIPNVEDVKITREGTSWSFGHEANVLSFPTDIEDKHDAMTLSHKYLCPCIGFTETEAVYAIAVNYQTFGEALLDGKVWDGQLLKWCEQTAHALRYLHSKSIAHGNLTPKNIFLSRDHSFVLLIDYLDACRSPKHAWHAFDPSISPSSDIWDLGWLIWMALNKGNVPMTLETRSLKNLPKPSKNLNGELFDIVSACWAKESYSRPPLDAIIDALQTEIKQRCDAEDNEHGIVWNE